MVIPFSAFAAAASAAGGGGGGFSLGAGGGGILGSILGGGLGSIFGRKKRTGFGKALNRGLYAQRATLEAGVQNFEDFGGRFMDAFRGNSPVFGALEGRVLGDLNDEGRTSRLEQAFQSRLMQQQTASGTALSPTGALRRSFAGLQFSEQRRDAAFDRAMGFQQNLAQPLATGFFNAGRMNLSSDQTFQQQAFSAGAQGATNQSILNGIQDGFATGVGFGARGQNRNRQGGMVGQIASLFGG